MKYEVSTKLTKPIKTKEYNDYWKIRRQKWQEINDSGFSKCKRRNLKKAWRLAHPEPKVNQSIIEKTYCVEAPTGNYRKDSVERAILLAVETGLNKILLCSKKGNYQYKPYVIIDYKEEKYTATY